MLCYLSSNFFPNASAELLSELARREKEANIKPDPDVDIYMKVGRNLLSITAFAKEIVALNFFILKRGCGSVD